MDFGRQRDWNGGSVYSACRQDDALGRRWETVPSLGLIFRLALCGDDGRRFSAVFSFVATSVKTPVRPMWSFGAGLGGVVRLVSVQLIEPDARTLVHSKRESGEAVTCGDLTATAWRKPKTLSQSSMMVTNVSAVACFIFPIFVVF